MNELCQHNQPHDFLYDSQEMGGGVIKYTASCRRCLYEKSWEEGGE